MKNIPVKNIVFFDVETVAAKRTYKELDDRWQALWNKKAANLKNPLELGPDELYERAGIYAEFGKIVCISAGIFVENEAKPTLRVKSYYGHEEKELLQEFSEMLTSLGSYKILCGHNAKEFDIPYVCRRMLINKVDLPPILNLHGKKPWEIPHLDTMEMWRFGDWKAFTSLDLLAACFNIPTPKDDIDGSQVKQVYYEENDLERIRIYCEKDVITLANLMRAYMGQNVLLPEEIEKAE